jgi:hypothetical protein
MKMRKGTKREILNYQVSALRNQGNVLSPLERKTIIGKSNKFANHVLASISLSMVYGLSIPLTPVIQDNHTIGILLFSYSGWASYNFVRSANFFSRCLKEQIPQDDLLRILP